MTKKLIMRIFSSLVLSGAPMLQAKEPLTVTVWIHGTKVQPHLPDIISNVEIPGLHHFTHCPQGMHKATELASKFHHRAIADTLCTQNPDQYNLEHFYIFGWSGKLDAQERLTTAHRLYKDLCSLVNTYESQGYTTPRLRIITHSHGGNVALNMARVPQSTRPLRIHELILLACPVQQETSDLLDSPVFNKIYSLYSTFDLIQRADPQILSLVQKNIRAYLLTGSTEHLKDILAIIKDSPFFSDRIFKPHTNLIQAAIASNRRGLAHLEFKFLYFVHRLPDIIHQLEVNQQLNPNLHHFFIRLKKDTLQIESL